MVNHDRRYGQSHDGGQLVGRAARHFQTFYLPKISHVIVVSFVLVVLHFRCPQLSQLTTYTYLFYASHAMSMMLFLTTSFLDPGYVSRGSVRTLLESMGSGSSFATTHPESSASENDDEDSDEEPLLQLSYKDTPIAFRRCNYCQLMQPLRAKHCEECERCIRKFDHHCPWLGNCVGEKNHKFFWCLLLSGLITTSWTLHITYQSFVSDSDGLLDFLRSNVLIIICLLILGLFFCACTVLFSAHTYLMLSNQTSWEFMARSKITYLRDLGDENPFDSGLLHNVYGFLCNCKVHDWECHFMNISSPSNGSPRSRSHNTSSVHYSQRKHKPTNLEKPEADHDDDFVNTV